MTPAQLRARNPEWATIATLVGGAAALLTTLGWTVRNPREELAQYAAQQAQVTLSVQEAIAAQSRRIDSLAAGLRYVRLLVDAQCVQAEERRDRMTLKTLECER